MPGPAGDGVTFPVGEPSVVGGLLSSGGLGWTNLLKPQLAASSKEYSDWFDLDSLGQTSSDDAVKLSGAQTGIAVESAYGSSMGASPTSIPNRLAQGEKADVVILAGAPLAGLAAKVRERIPVPVIDQVQAAVRQAQTLALLRPLKARTGSFARPAGKESVGLAGPLADWIKMLPTLKRKGRRQ